MELISVFQWLDQSALAEFSKAYGGVFAIVQVAHILAMILLGGMIITGDLRLLGVLMKDIPSESVLESTHKWIAPALIVAIASGSYMTSAIAMKIYHSAFFWSKMSWLAAGLVMVYLIRKPLLKFDHASINPWTIKLMALASITIWFNVAGAGRWIGFS
jgi:hypothetical protein